MNPIVVWEVLKSGAKIGEDLVAWMKARNISPMAVLNAVLMGALIFAGSGQIKAIASFVGLSSGRDAGVEAMKQEAIEAHKQVEAAKLPFVDFLWDRRWRSFDSHLSGVRAGRFTVEPYEVMTIAVEMLKGKRVQQTLLATSSTQSWWESQEGKNYERMNFDLVDNGVRITRIFIYEDQRELDALKPIMERQQRHGIKVRCVRRDPNMSDDYVVLDGKCAGILRLTTKREMIQAEFVFDAGTVAQVQEKFSMIELKAVAI